MLAGRTHQGRHPVHKSLPHQQERLPSVVQIPPVFPEEFVQGSYCAPYIDVTLPPNYGSLQIVPSIFIVNNTSNTTSQERKTHL